MLYLFNHRSVLVAFYGDSRRSSSRGLYSGTPQEATDTYLAAQSGGKPLTGVTEYFKNEKMAAIASGIQPQALKIGHNRSYFDITTCATYTEVVVADKAKPYVTGTPLDLTDGKISTVQSLVTTTGDWLFNATGTLYYTAKENWGLITVAD